MPLRRQPGSGAERAVTVGEVVHVPFQSAVSGLLQKALEPFVFAAMVAMQEEASRERIRRLLGPDITSIAAAGAVDREFVLVDSRWRCASRVTQANGNVSPC